MAIVKFEIDTLTTPMDAVTEVLRILSGGNPAPAKKKAAEQVKAPEVETPKAEMAEAPKSETPAKAVTIEQVRAAVAEKRTSHRQEIKDILTKHGSESVTTLAPEKYAEVLNEIKAL